MATLRAGAIASLVLVAFPDSLHPGSDYVEPGALRGRGGYNLEP